MPALTPEWLHDFESEMQVIQEDEYAALSEDLFWSDLAVVRNSTSRRELLTFFLKTAMIEDLGVKGGKVTFDDLVSKYTEVENRFAGNGLKLARQQIEDTDGNGVHLGEEWAKQTAAEVAYWPQGKLVDLINAGETGIGYDGIAYFAKNHQNLPGDTTVTYANLFSGAAASTPATDPGDALYPGAIDILALTDDAAIAALGNLRAYVASIVMPDGKRPRRLRPLDFYAGPKVATRLAHLTKTTLISKDTQTAGAGGSADVKGLVEHLKFGKVVEVDEFSSFNGFYFSSSIRSQKSALGAFARTMREPFSTRFFGVMDSDALSRMEELEWHNKGRDGYAYGHPYLFGKVKAT
jgi:hypothetical protein